MPLLNGQAESQGGEWEGTLVLFSSLRVLAALPHLSAHQ